MLVSIQIDKYTKKKKIDKIITTLNLKHLTRGQISMRLDVSIVVYAQLNPRKANPLKFFFIWSLKRSHDVKNIFKKKIIILFESPLSKGIVDGGIDSGSEANLVSAFKSIWHEIAEFICMYYIQLLNSLHRYVHVP